MACESNLAHSVPTCSARFISVISGKYKNPFPSLPTREQWGLLQSTAQIPVSKGSLLSWLSPHQGSSLMNPPPKPPPPGNGCYKGSSGGYIREINVLPGIQMGPQSGLFKFRDPHEGGGNWSQPQPRPHFCQVPTWLGTLLFPMVLKVWSLDQQQHVWGTVSQLCFQRPRPKENSQCEIYSLQLHLKNCFFFFFFFLTIQGINHLDLGELLPH